jgi:hypothetical protein
MLVPDTILKLIPNPSAGARDLNLAADEWRVLTMTNGVNTLAAIAERTQLAPERVIEIAEQLMLHGLIVRSGGPLDLQLTEREFETWYEAGHAERIDELFPISLAPEQSKKIAFHAFMVQRPELRRRQALVEIGQQLVAELLRYHLTLAAHARRRALAQAPQISARLEAEASAIERSCARLLGECGLIALRLGLVRQEQCAPASAPEHHGWLWQAALEDFAGGIIGWYRDMLEELTQLFEQLLAGDNTSIDFISEHAPPAVSPAPSQGELHDLPGLDATPDPASALQRLFDQLSTIEARLHALIVQPPEDGATSPLK